VSLLQKAQVNGVFKRDFGKHSHRSITVFPWAEDIKKRATRPKATFLDRFDEKNLNL
jgi:hypothetical protein